MPKIDGSSWVSGTTSLISILWYYVSKLVKGAFSLCGAAAEALFKSTIQPLIKVLTLFFWSPAQILLKNLFRIILMPTNLPLLFFYDTTLDDIKKVNFHMAIVTVTTCIQYFITLLIIGVFFGVYCGISLGLIHRFARIPDRYIDLPQGIFNRVLSPFKQKDAITPPIKYTYENDIPTPSTISLGNRSFHTQRRVSRSSRGSVSNAVSHLPHDFFQPKTPSMQQEKRRPDPVRMSPLSMEIDDSSETTSISSNMWDYTENLPETLRTDVTGGTYQIPRSFTSGRDSSSLLASKAVKRGV